MNTPAPLKSLMSEVVMQYNNGDRLKYSGISGNYSTVMTGIPTVRNLVSQ